MLHGACDGLGVVAQVEIHGQRVGVPGTLRLSAVLVILKSEVNHFVGRTARPGQATCPGATCCENSGNSKDARDVLETMSCAQPRRASGASLNTWRRVPRFQANSLIRKTAIRTQPETNQAQD